jgi:hypothetical protein
MPHPSTFGKIVSGQPLFRSLRGRIDSRVEKEIHVHDAHAVFVS